MSRSYSAIPTSYLGQDTPALHHRIGGSLDTLEASFIPFVGNEDSLAQLPAPPEPTRAQRGLLLQDGSLHQWADDRGHIEYMEDQGFEPHHVQGYMTWNPSEQRWRSLNRFKADYEHWYDERNPSVGDWNFEAKAEVPDPQHMPNSTRILLLHDGRAIIGAQAHEELARDHGLKARDIKDYGYSWDGQWNWLSPDESQWRDKWVDTPSVDWDFEAAQKQADAVGGPWDEDDWTRVMGQAAYDEWQFSDRAGNENTPYGVESPEEWQGLEELASKSTSKDSKLTWSLRSTSGVERAKSTQVDDSRNWENMPHLPALKLKDGSVLLGDENQEHYDVATSNGVTQDQLDSLGLHDGQGNVQWTDHKIRPPEDLFRWDFESSAEWITPAGFPEWQPGRDGRFVVDLNGQEHRWADLDRESGDDDGLTFSPDHSDFSEFFPHIEMADMGFISKNGQRLTDATDWSFESASAANAARKLAKEPPQFHESLPDAESQPFMIRVLQLKDGSCVTGMDHHHQLAAKAGVTADQIANFGTRNYDGGWSWLTGSAADMRSDWVTSQPGFPEMQDDWNFEGSIKRSDKPEDCPKQDSEGNAENDAENHLAIEQDRDDDPGDAHEDKRSKHSVTQGVDSEQGQHSANEQDSEHRRSIAEHAWIRLHDGRMIQGESRDEHHAQLMQRNGVEPRDVEAWGFGDTEYPSPEQGLQKRIEQWEFYSTQEWVTPEGHKPWSAGEPGRFIRMKDGTEYRWAGDWPYHSEMSDELGLRVRDIHQMGTLGESEDWQRYWAENPRHSKAESGFAYHGPLHNQTSHARNLRNQDHSAPYLRELRHFLADLKDQADVLEHEHGYLPLPGWEHTPWVPGTQGNYITLNDGTEYRWAPNGPMHMSALSDLGLEPDEIQAAGYVEPDGQHGGKSIGVGIALGEDDWRFSAGNRPSFKEFLGSLERGEPIEKLGEHSLTPPNRQPWTGQGRGRFIELWDGTRLEWTVPDTMDPEGDHWTVQADLGLSTADIKHQGYLPDTDAWDTENDWRFSAEDWLPLPNTDPWVPGTRGCYLIAPDGTEYRWDLYGPFHADAARSVGLNLRQVAAAGYIDGQGKPTSGSGELENMQGWDFEASSKTLAPPEPNLPWIPGTAGSYLIARDGSVVLWRRDLGDPNTFHHAEMMTWFAENGYPQFGGDVAGGDIAPDPEGQDAAWIYWDGRVDIGRILGGLGITLEKSKANSDSESAGQLWKLASEVALPSGVEPWTLGEAGSIIVTPEGDALTWSREDIENAPHHAEMIEHLYNHRLFGEVADGDIYPNGTVVFYHVPDGLAPRLNDILAQHGIKGWEDYRDNGWDFTAAASDEWIQDSRVDDDRYESWEEGFLDNFYYHTAPTADRQRIQQHGLQPSHPKRNERWHEPVEDWDESYAPPGWLQNQPEGVYVTEHPDAAENWAFDTGLGTDPDEQAPNWDIWRIPRNEVQETIPDTVGNAEVIPHSVHPELHYPGEWSLGGWSTPKQATSLPNVIRYDDAAPARAPYLLHDGGAPVIYYPERYEVHLGQPGDYHLDLGPIVTRKGDGYDEAHHGRLTEDGSGVEWYAAHHDPDGLASKALGFDENAVYRNADNWNFSRTTSGQQISIMEHNFDVTPPWSEDGVVGFRGRRPLTYDPTQNIVHVGPDGADHMTLINQLQAKGYPITYSGNEQGWYGPNPEAPESFGDEFGWYDQSPGPHVDQAIKDNLGAAPVKRDDWNFAAKIRDRLKKGWRFTKKMFSGNQYEVPPGLNLEPWEPGSWGKIIRIYDDQGTREYAWREEDTARETNHYDIAERLGIRGLWDGMYLKPDGTEVGRGAWLYPDNQWSFEAGAWGISDAQPNNQLALDPWEMGYRGKAILFNDGEMVHWKNQGVLDSAHHLDALKMLGRDKKDVRGFFYINREGQVDGRRELVPEAQQALNIPQTQNIPEEESDMWVFTKQAANSLQWEPGGWGKGLVTNDGYTHTWRTDGPLDGYPAHFEYKDDHQLTDERVDIENEFWINPEGEISFAYGSPESTFWEIALRADPRLTLTDISNAEAEKQWGFDFGVERPGWSTKPGPFSKTLPEHRWSYAA